jgi:hypothetical protein
MVIRTAGNSGAVPRSPQLIGLRVYSCYQTRLRECFEFVTMTRISDNLNKLVLRLNKPRRVYSRYASVISKKELFP